MHGKLVRGLITLGVVVVVGSWIVAATVRPARSGAVPGPLYLDLVENPFAAHGGAGLLAAPLPPNGSDWHELYPTLNAGHVQQSYSDNGDAVISIGDYIRLDGMDYRITWAGPTYFVTSSSVHRAWEPSLMPHNNANPVGETWSEVTPGFGSLISITGWSDNGTGVVDPGDDLTALINGGAPIVAKVDGVGTNITVEPIPAVPATPSGWGRLKSLFGGR